MSTAVAGSCAHNPPTSIMYTFNSNLYSNMATPNTPTMAAAPPATRPVGAVPAELVLATDADADADAEDAAHRARSPAASETSNFTSVSQRGINPNWRPAPGAPGYGGVPGLPANAWGGGVAGSQFSARGGGAAGGGRWKGEASSSLSVLEGNPDFMLPGVGLASRARGSGGAGMGMGMGMKGSPARGARQGAGPGMLGVGRYPTDV